MVLILAPTAVFAAKPLVYCVGANAHKAFEYVYVAGPNHHSSGAMTQRLGGAHPGGRSGASAAVPVDSCIDFAVLSTARLAEQKIDSKLAPPPFPPANQLRFNAVSEYESAEQACNSLFASRVTRVLHPQLAGLRTTKLLN